MLRYVLASWCVLLPALTLACDGRDRASCKDELITLIALRAEAIDRAFGPAFDTLGEDIRVVFVGSKDQEFDRYSGRPAYDPVRRTFILPRKYIGAKTPKPMRWAGYYWPYYKNELYQREFPVIAVIDSVLWGAYLQEVARAHGQSWPHAECFSHDIGKRLPCEMLIAGIAAHVTDLNPPLFNTNRLDRIWPEDFRTKVWRKEEQEYVDVQHYGGLMLIHALVEEFGMLPALEFVARTPFVLIDGNLRVSAQHYRERARQELSDSTVDTTREATAVADKVQTVPSLGRVAVTEGAPVLR